MEAKMSRLRQKIEVRLPQIRALRHPCCRAEAQRKKWWSEWMGRCKIALMALNALAARWGET